MKKTLILILSVLWLQGLSASATDHRQEIAFWESQTGSLMRERAARGAMMEYCYWAQDSITVGAYTSAVDIYLQALQDTFLLHDHHTFVAVNLAKLYNNHLLMHQSAAQILNDYRFTEDYRRDSWQWDLALAQTQTYLKRYDEALAIYDSLLRVVPNPKFDLIASRGYLHLAMQNYTDAIHDLSQAMRTADSTNYYRIAGNIAFAKAVTHNCQEAVDNISACLRYAERIGHDIDVTIYHRKRAQIHLLCGDTAASLADYRIYWQREKQYIIDHFASMTEQQRLDYWANRKPLVSGALQLGSYDPSFIADIAVFRHQAALLGALDTTTAILRARMQVDAKTVQKCLDKEEAAIEFVKYREKASWLYAAVVIQADQIHFVPLCTEDQFPMEEICSASADDKNALYSSYELASLIWMPLLPYIRQVKELWFAPDGVLNMVAIEYLPFPLSEQPVMHRLTSTGLLAKRTKTNTGQKSNALLIGGLNYDHMSGEAPTSSATNQNGLRYWVNTRNHLALFNYLPGSRKEVDDIAPNIEKWEKTYEESEEMLKSEFGLFNLVHLSTHGYSLEVAVKQPDDVWSDSITTDNSLLGTGIALSGANISYRYPNREDGLLTGREICELDLRNVDFVVASACQSAQGKINDEGPAGLLRSLKLAGVGCVLATLWPVDDTATTLFMNYFYEEWQNGKKATKQQALSQAQLRLRQYGTEQPRTKRTFNPATLHGKYEQVQTPLYDAPYYWAPFILVDDLEKTK